jgi:hypothetical protein
VTVAVCGAKAPEVPVTVSVYVPLAVLLLGAPEPEQAESVTQMQIADTRDRRVRRRCVDRIRKSSINATKSGTIRIMLMGGTRFETGTGTIIACAVNDSVDVVAGGVMVVGLRTQEDFAGAPVQVSATGELKPPVGFTVMVTGAATAP